MTHNTHHVNWKMPIIDRRSSINCPIVQWREKELVADYYVSSGMATVKWRFHQQKVTPTKHTINRKLCHGHRQKQWQQSQQQRQHHKRDQIPAGKRDFSKSQQQTRAVIRC